MLRGSCLDWAFFFFGETKASKAGVILSREEESTPSVL